MPWSVLWGFTSAVFVLNAFAAWRDFGHYSDELGASAVMVLLLQASMLFHNDRAFLAVFDLGALALCARWFWYRPRVWSFVIGFVFLVQLWGHAGFQEGDLSHNSNAYTEFLNVTYVIQLIALGFPGGQYALARAFDAGMRSRRARHFRPVGSQ